jgi:hypothetical protein
MSTPGVPSPAEPPRADWKRAADGIGLAGFAVFLLLCTTGALPWSFWLDAIPLWPLLVMSAGVQVAFDKTRAPWLVLLGPAIVLGGLAWVATGARTERDVGPWSSEGPLPRPEGAARVSLDLRLVASRLSVFARDLEGGALADARSIERGGKATLALKREGDTARVRLDTGGADGVAILPGRRQRWELGVPTDLPLDFGVEGFFVRSRLELAAARQLTAGRVNGVFLVTQVSLPPTNEPVTIRVNGAFSVLRLSVPEGTPVKVSGTGFPFNLIKRRVVGDPGRPGYEVRLEGVFGAVAVDTRRAPRDAEGAGGRPPAEAPPNASPAPASPEAPPVPTGAPSPAVPTAPPPAHHG